MNIKYRIRYTIVNIQNLLRLISVPFIIHLHKYKNYKMKSFLNFKREIIKKNSTCS